MAASFADKETVEMLAVESVKTLLGAENNVGFLARETTESMP